jgi:hypothetical protein
MTREKIYVRKLKDGSSKWLVTTPLDGTIARVSSYQAAINLAVALATESVCAVPECEEPVAEQCAFEGEWCPEHWAEHTRECPACAALNLAAAVKASER